MTMGKRLRAARKRQGMTAEKLAIEVGCSQSSISQFERDVRTPPARTLMLIAKALNCRVTDLITAEYIRTENAANFDAYDVFSPWESNDSISENECMRFSITFEKLNSEGRRRVFEFMEDLAEISRYRIDFGENQ